MVLQTKKIFSCLFLFLLLCRCVILAQVGFTATISPGTIGKNETAELKLMVDNARQVDQIVPPSFKDFNVLSGPNQESGMESINGVTRQYMGITYLLKPKSTGKFTLGIAIAKADGKTLKSNLVTLVVTKRASGNNQNNSASGLGGFSPFPEPVVQSSFDDFIIKKGENIAEKVSKNIFIKVDVSKSSCYVGEPVTVTYKLYTRLKSESSITKNPSFNGFSVIDLLPPGNNYYSTEKLNGREYNVYTLRKSQLYPLQAGPVELEIAEVENNIHFIKEEYLNRQRNGVDDMFRDFTQTTIPAEGIQDEKVTLQSKQALIIVKPLPEKDQPNAFKGSVGDFSIEAAMEKNSFTTDDAGKLSIVIIGQGNMSMIIAPDINWPEGIETYESRSSEQLDKTAVPVSGRKFFEFPFTAAQPGNYTIPAIAFSFFNVKEGRYQTVNTKPFSLIVTKGVGKKPVILNTPPEKAGQEAFFDILFTNRWLIVIPVAVLILTGLFVWVRKDKKKNLAETIIEKKASKVFPPEGKELTDVPVNPFIVTEEKLVGHDTRGFYEALNIELRKFLSDQLQIPLATINKKRIAEEADKKGVSLHTCLQIQHLLDDLELQLYTPFATENKMQDMYNDADAIVHALRTTTP